MPRYTGASNTPSDSDIESSVNTAFKSLKDAISKNQNAFVIMDQLSSFDWDEYDKKRYQFAKVKKIQLATELAEKAEKNPGYLAINSNNQMHTMVNFLSCILKEESANNIKTPCLEALKKWFKENRGSINNLGPFDASLLHTAACCGSLEVSRFLLEEGIDTTLLNSSKETALQRMLSSSTYNYPEIIILIDEHNKTHLTEEQRLKMDSAFKESRLANARNQLAKREKEHEEAKALAPKLGLPVPQHYAESLESIKNIIAHYEAGDFSPPQKSKSISEMNSEELRERYEQQKKLAEEIAELKAWQTAVANYHKPEEGKAPAMSVFRPASSDDGAASKDALPGMVP